MCVFVCLCIDLILRIESDLLYLHAYQSYCASYLYRKKTIHIYLEIE